MKLESLSNIRIKVDGVQSLIQNLKPERAVGPDMIGKRDRDDF